MSIANKILQAAAGNVAGGYEYNYLGFHQANASGATNFFDNYLSVADVSDPTSLSMHNIKLLDNGYFNYYMRGLAGDPEDRIIFCTSQQGAKIYAVQLESSMAYAWQKNVSSVKALAHDIENKILYYISGNNTLNAVNSTNGNSLGTLSLSSMSFTPSQIFNLVLVDDNTRLVALESYVSSSTADCLATFDVSNPASMSIDSEDAVDVYNNEATGAGYDADNEILWVPAYYDSKIFGLTKSGSGWTKSYTITTSSPQGMAVLDGLDGVAVGTSGEIQFWDVSSPSSPVKDYSSTANPQRQLALAFDETAQYIYGTRFPSNTSWGISSWDVSGGLSSPTHYNLANLGSPYTSYTRYNSFNIALA